MPRSGHDSAGYLTRDLREAVVLSPLRVGGNIEATSHALDQTASKKPREPHPAEPGGLQIDRANNAVSADERKYLI